MSRLPIKMSKSTHNLIQKSNDEIKTLLDSVKVETPKETASTTTQYEPGGVKCHVDK